MSHGESHPLYIFYSSPNCIFTRRHSFDTHERFLFQFKSHNLISSYPGVIVTSHVFLFSEGIKWTTALKYFQSMLRYWEMLIACWWCFFGLVALGLKLLYLSIMLGFISRALFSAFLRICGALGSWTPGRFDVRAGRLVQRAIDESRSLSTVYRVSRNASLLYYIPVGIKSRSAYL